MLTGVLHLIRPVPDKRGITVIKLLMNLYTANAG